MTARRLLDDCFLHDSERLRHHDVLDLLKIRLTCVCDAEPVETLSASGRVLAESVTAQLENPPRDNAAVDGYAVRHVDYLEMNGRLPVRMRCAAGDAVLEPLPPQSAARIFTGAFLPTGADTIVMQEDCDRDADQLTIPPGLRVGANRRRAGEDVTVGETLLPAGHRLRPQDLASIAGQGLASVRCRGSLRIRLFSTGDEIAPINATLRPGQIHDANHAMLQALVRHWPGEIIGFQHLPDNRRTVERALRDAAADCDVIITTGGASRGEEDHIVEALTALGRRHIWQLAIKPGRPLTVGQIGDTVVFGLPGNPVAVFVCALLYLRPALHLLQGAAWPDTPAFMLPSVFSMAKKAGRREFLRGVAVRRGERVIGIDKFARDGSGLLSGLRASDGLIEVAEDVTQIRSGDPLLFRPYSSFGVS